MAAPELPEMPVQLKTIQPYLKIAKEYDQRDIVVSYWCRLYALQTGLKLSTKTSEESNFLLKLMDWLESTKKANHENEAITNEIVAQAHMENWALKLFLYADKQDRACNFGKSVVRSFFTSGLLFDTLTVFGPLGDEMIQNKKYAKWKAAYIFNCQKNGETPLPGSMKQGENDSNENVDNDLAYNEDGEDNENIQVYGNISQPIEPSQLNLPTYPMMPMQPTIPIPPTNMDAFGFPSVPEPHPYNPAPTPTYPSSSNVSTFDNQPSVLTGAVTLTVEKTTKAQKYIKWAGSALNYDDIPTTITNLEKALNLLRTGEDLV